jgi:branched-chain amino acid aminotransferase
MLQSTKYIWQNGEFVLWEDAKIHVLTHTLHYGGGVFEGIRCYETANGPAIFRLNEHLDRLFYSANALGMTISYSKDKVADIIKQLIIKNNVSSAYIRPLVIYGYNKMGVNPLGNPVELIIACWPWDKYLPHESIAVKISKYIRIHPESTVVDAKISGHYVNSILASLEVQGTHYHEALLLDCNGNIAEGVGENFFIVREGIIYTPQLGYILNGITRDTVIQLARSFGYKVIEETISVEEAYQADEAFFTGTAVEVTAIHSINDHPIGNGQVGQITSQLKTAFYDLVQGRSKRFSEFLTYV